MHLKYYNAINNFGDIVNPKIIQFLTEEKPDEIDIKNISYPGLLAIGSILHYAGPHDIIWGSGCIANNIKLKFISKTTKICLVRGPLTKNELLKYGINYNGGYCDPGVLIPLAYNVDELKNNSSIQYEYGIIPHCSEMNLKKIQELKISKRNDVLIISMLDNGESILKKILSCQKIISSSLHGIVLAEVLKRQTSWCILSDNVIGNGFKFYDYFYGSSRNKNDVQFCDWRKKLQFGLEKSIKPPKYNVEVLLQTFPLLLNEEKKKIILNWFKNEQLI